MPRLSAFSSDRRGVAAMEFALIAPIIVALLVLGVDGWLQGTETSQARTAIHTGARYYETGGGDDTVAQTVAMSAWQSKPADAALNVVRSCTCAATPVACSTLCAGSNPPSTFISLSATGTYSGLVHQHAISQSDIIRVR
jgi:Flp pilus assembly protein TadG